jgi:hypothetical protein
VINDASWQLLRFVFVILRYLYVWFLHLSTTVIIAVIMHMERAAQMNRKTLTRRLGVLWLFRLAASSEDHHRRKVRLPALGSGSLEVLQNFLSLQFLQFLRRPPINHRDGNFSSFLPSDPL